MDVEFFLSKIKLSGVLKLISLLYNVFIKNGSISPSPCLA